MKSTGVIVPGGWSSLFNAPCGDSSGNRVRTLCYECEPPGRYKYQIFVQVAEGGTHQCLRQGKQ